MVRFNVSQTVWKNSEDEILKAAVMKYGLNQWGRVASLFAKRSARQCKARWDEWLDPNIKKTEWSREEDEKLLHLAKLMPTQWRTIAPIVGRTAAQCLERYERLLDMAAGEAPPDDSADEGEGGTSGDDEGGDPAKRRKRAAPAETLPAKPDAQDMDEEELEMLSEARARLANTLGKKAKRKARERQLEEQQRIAQLQKRRELKAAGIAGGKVAVVDNRKRRRKNSDAEHIDYTQEVPFEQPAPINGPHDVTKEKMDSARRERDERARMEKLNAANDMKKQQEKKMKRKAERVGVKELEARLATERRKAEEALAVARSARTALTLPAPQISETELEDVAKVSSSTTLAPFAPPPLPMNKRTDLVMQEARNQLARDGRSDVMADGHGTGFGGIVPSSDRATDQHLKRGLASLASRRTFAGANGRVVVLRDELGLNRDIPISGGGNDDESVAAEDAEELAELAAKGLKVKLGSLPAPEYEYSVQVNAAQNKYDEDEDDNGRMKEDARNSERKRLKLVEEKHKKMADARPSAVKLGLPDISIDNLSVVIKEESDPARKLVWEEMHRGLLTDKANSVDMKLVAELGDVAAAILDESVLSQLVFFDDFSFESRPLELFIAARSAAASVAKGNEQLFKIAQDTVHADQTKAESAIVEYAQLFKQSRKVHFDLEVKTWMKNTEARAVHDRLARLRQEVDSLSSQEGELQRRFADKTLSK